MKISFSIILFLVGFLFFVNLPVFSQTDSLGIFEGHTDIGKVMYPGSAKYKAEPEEYEIQSPANDTQKNEEGFHFVWKSIKGDFIFYAQVNLPEKDSNFSGSAGCMVRTNLNENSANIKSSIDERGHTDIQFRRNGGESMGEIESSLKEANIIQIERAENTYTISIAKFGEPFVIKQVKDLDLGDEVYVGLYTASANQSRVERGIYSNVRFTIPVPKVLSLFRTDIGSNLEVLDIETGNRKILLVDSNSVHSPIWKKDGETLIYAKQGLLYTFNLTNKICRLLNTGMKKSNSNDHVLSFDGKMLSFCVPTEEKGGPIVYTVPVTGGEPKQINKIAPSYPHSWSPDGKTLLLSASRKGEFEIYKVAASGGKEYGITNSPGMDDCPEYTPDGKQIYFNSNRTGAMRIWRMNADGSEPEVVTTGEYYDWFPHISPDGKWMVFLSYSKDDASASGHPSYRQVYLRLMPVSGGQPKIIAYLYGGQGSINSPCWSPDSKKIAFASYSDTQY